MSDIRIKIHKYPGPIEVFNAETGEPFLGIRAFHLTATPNQMEAKIITDEALLEGNWVESEGTVPVTEQLVLSEVFLDMLAKLVAEQLKRELLNSMKYYEERDAKLEWWCDSLDHEREQLIESIAYKVEERLVCKLKEPGGILS